MPKSISCSRLQTKHGCKRCAHCAHRDTAKHEGREPQPISHKVKLGFSAIQALCLLCMSRRSADDFVGQAVGFRFAHCDGATGRPYDWAGLCSRLDHSLSGIEECCLFICSLPKFDQDAPISGALLEPICPESFSNDGQPLFFTSSGRFMLTQFRFRCRFLCRFQRTLGSPSLHVVIYTC